MAQLFNCGFVRAALLATAKTASSAHVLDAAYDALINKFSYTKEKRQFKPLYKKFLDKVRNKKWHQDSKNEYLSYFSMDEWEKLHAEERLSHTLSNCAQCLKNHETMHRKFVLAAQPMTPQRVLKDITNVTPKVNRKTIEKAGRIWESANVEWENSGETTPLNKVWSGMPRTKIAKRKTGNENLSDLRKVQAEIRDHQQEQWKQDGRDLDTVLATRQSFNKYGKQRKLLYFETKSDAIKRSNTQTSTKRHVEPLEVWTTNQDFRAQELLNYVKSQEEKLNLTDLARKFGVPNKDNLGNVRVKEFLISQGIQHESLETKNTVRKKKNKNPHGTNVSVAVPRTENALKAALREALENGKYSLGDLIEPKTFKKLVYGEDGPEEIDFTVCGRKIPLIDIRNQLNEKHSDMGIFRKQIDNETRLNLNITRYLSVWSDHSSILNHGYLVLTVKPIFTTDTYYSSKEMKELFGIHVNVPEVVETPSMYIMACSSDSTADKLCYAECRLDDILDLSIKTEIDGVEIKDILRGFHADHPEISFEAGTSKGGTYPCICQCSVQKFSDLEYIYENNDLLSIDELRKEAIKGPAGRKSLVNPFHDLTKDQLKKEVGDRWIDTFRKDGREPTKEQLEQALKHHLKGIHRVPTLFYKNELRTAAAINALFYEIFACEPLHDIKGHILNLWTELKHVLSDKQQEAFEDTLKTAYGGKDKKKGVDYRKSVLMVYFKLVEKASKPNSTCKPVSPEVEELLYTLVVLCKLSYQSPELRSPKTVLMMYNITFRHACIVLKLFGKKWLSSKTTNEKFYGLYWHSIISHFADTHRIIPLSSLHAEEEERTFSQLNSISEGTSSRKEDHVRDNSIIRLQAEAKVKREEGRTAPWKSEISKLSSYFGPLKRSSFNLNEYNDQLWKAHLKRIADFLAVGEGKWWTRKGNVIEFHDGDEDPDTLPDGPELMEFTRYTYQSSKAAVKTYWEQCNRDPGSLPLLTVPEVDSPEDVVEHDAEPITAACHPDAVSDIGIPQADDHDVVEELVEQPKQKKRRLNFQSEEANDIYDVIGNHLLLNNYDKNITEYKVGKYANALATCKKCMRKMVVDVRKKREETQRWMRKWENDFFLENEHEPAYSDFSDEALSAYELIVTADKVLRAASNIGC